MWYWAPLGMDSRARARERERVDRLSLHNGLGGSTQETTVAEGAEDHVPGSTHLDLNVCFLI